MNQLILQVARLLGEQLRMVTDVKRLKGSNLERRYRERGHAYFGRLVRRVHVLSGDGLFALLDEAVAGGRLSEEESDEILQADVVVRRRFSRDHPAFAKSAPLHAASLHRLDEGFLP
ncbi:MAG: hypothetical protein IH870_03390 [Chloroflexi bacterium]|nr:hypothetical protein [Chloroflexota bacterium]